MSFFFQAEDGIRDGRVTGVQTCALPILGTVANRACAASSHRSRETDQGAGATTFGDTDHGVGRRKTRPQGRAREIGRASCRERGEIAGVAVALKKKVAKERSVCMVMVMG